MQIGRLLPPFHARRAAVRRPRPVPPAGPSCRPATGGNSRAGRRSRGDAERAGRHAQQLAMRVLRRRGRHVEDCPWQARAPAGRRAARSRGANAVVMRPAQNSHSKAASRRSSPTSRPCPWRRLCRRRRSGPRVDDSAIDLLDKRALSPGPFGQAAVDAFVLARRAPCASASAARSRSAAATPHAPNIRTARRFLPGAAASSSSDMRIGAKPREQRHVVRAHHGADGIDLQQAEPLEHLRFRWRRVIGPAGRGSAKPCAASAMRRASGKRDLFLHARNPE